MGDRLGLHAEDPQVVGDRPPGVGDELQHLGEPPSLEQRLQGVDHVHGAEEVLDAGSGFPPRPAVEAHVAEPDLVSVRFGAEGVEAADRGLPVSPHRLQPSEVDPRLEAALRDLRVARLVRATCVVAHLRLA